MSPPNDRRSTAKNAAERTVETSRADSVPSVTQLTDLGRERRKRWAAALIRKGRESGVTCVYGDDMWCRLPQDHPARIAAVVVAAECHAQDGDDLPRRLRAELDAARAAEQQREAEDFAVVAATVRGRAGQVPHAVLAERRGDISAEELVEWERRNREFVAGRTDEPARLPRREA